MVQQSFASPESSVHLHKNNKEREGVETDFVCVKADSG